MSPLSANSVVSLKILHLTSRSHNCFSGSHYIFSFLLSWSLKMGIAKQGHPHLLLGKSGSGLVMYVARHSCALWPDTGDTLKQEGRIVVVADVAMSIARGLRCH